MSTSFYELPGLYRHPERKGFSPFYSYCSSHSHLSVEQMWHRTLSIELLRSSLSAYSERWMQFSSVTRLSSNDKLSNLSETSIK
uniref:Uncharacterized protein n=1 Tax=Utricularia reniformis TaxID=192314 RepID=A0A1Y0AZL5_9LAMI|nr:hypothetical protein AEK19_MT0309 [Utricularia reniformis]ART30584.1 hypothetical protein AEK19_MT0309 [Utricularia reniformis]